MNKEFEKTWKEYTETLQIKHDVEEENKKNKVVITNYKHALVDQIHKVNEIKEVLKV